MTDVDSKSLSYFGSVLRLCEIGNIRDHSFEFRKYFSKSNLENIRKESKIGDVDSKSLN